MPPKKKPPTYGEMTAAIRKRDHKTFKRLLRRGGDPQATWRGRSLMDAAISAPSIGCVEAQASTSRPPESTACAR